MVFRVSRAAATAFCVFGRQRVRSYNALFAAGASAFPIGCVLFALIYVIEAQDSKLPVLLPGPIYLVTGMISFQAYPIGGGADLLFGLSREPFR